MPLGQQKIKLEPNEDCRVPDLLSSAKNTRSAAQSKTVLRGYDCGVDGAKTNIKMETGSTEAEMIYIKVEAEPELKPNPKTLKTRKRLPVETAGEVGQKLKRKKTQNAPRVAVQLSVKRTAVASSAGKGRKKHNQMVQTRVLPVPIQPKIVPSATVPDHQEQLSLTKPSQNNLQHSNESIPVADASSKFLKKASVPTSYCLQNQASLQQPTHLHPCISGQQTALNSCQNPVFIQVCGSQLASSSFSSANQLTCNPVVLPQNSISIQLAGNKAMPGISVMPRNLSVNPQLQFQSNAMVNNQGSLQIRIPSDQVVQTQQSSLHSLIPNQLVQGNFQNSINIQIPANQLVQTSSQNQVQINFPSSQLVQGSIQNPIQIQIPSTQLVQSGSQNTFQINTCTSSSQLVQHPIQIQIPARQVFQTNPTAPMLLPSLQSTNSKIKIKSPVLIKNKNPKTTVTILPNSPLIQNSTGQAEVQTCITQKTLNCDPCGKSSNTRYTQSKPLSKMTQVTRKPRNSKYPAQANLGSKATVQTQNSVRIQPSVTATPKFIPIQPSVNHLPQHSSPQNSLQVQVLSCDVLNAVQPQFPLQLGVPLSTTISYPSILEKPAVLQVVEQRLETSQSSASKFRIVSENRNRLETSSATLELRSSDSSKSPARTKLRGRALQQMAKKHSTSQNSSLCRISTRQMKTSVFSLNHESLHPRHESSGTNLQQPSLECSGHQLKQSALSVCEVAQVSGQLMGSSSLLPAYTIITADRNLQQEINLPNARTLETHPQSSTCSKSSFQVVHENIQSPAVDVLSKETGERIIVLGTSNFKKYSDTQCLSVSVPKIVTDSKQSKTPVPQRKAKSRFVPILPRPSDNQMCIFNQTANDEGNFWGAGKKKRKLVSNTLKQTKSTTIHRSFEGRQSSCQKLLAAQKCFVQLEMLNVEPNKFYSATDFKTVKSSHLRSKRQRTIKNEPAND